ncbi:hypothetical protein CsatA_015027 [Cannabis sativa]
MNVTISFTVGSNTTKKGGVGTLALNVGRSASELPPPLLHSSVGLATPTFHSPSLLRNSTPSVNVLNKQLNLTYNHTRAANQTALDATLLIDLTNKLLGSYGFGSGDCKLKYNYVYGGLRTFEPCYEFTKNFWDKTVSQRILDGGLKLLCKG